jgi:regulator of replication initiation timing
MDLTAFAAFLAVCVTAYTAFNSASRQEVKDLRERTTSLEAENGSLHRENTNLREYIGLLRAILREHGIDVPAMKEIEDKE